jgi:hypothetical protein
VSEVPMTAATTREMRKRGGVILFRWTDTQRMHGYVAQYN